MFSQLEGSSSREKKIDRGGEKERERENERTITIIDPPNFNKGHRVFAGQRDDCAAWAAL